MKLVCQKLILFTIEGYLDDISPYSTYNYEFMLKLRSAIRGYMTFHKLTPAEYKQIIALSDTEYMMKLRDVEVDRTLFALELLTMYISLVPKKQRATLNISDKKLLHAKSELIMDMLKLKRKDDASYKRVKEIADDSRITAKGYYGYAESFL